MCRRYRYTTAEGLPHNLANTLYRDRAGLLWIGTSGGVLRFRDGKFTYAPRHIELCVSDDGCGLDVSIPRVKTDGGGYGVRGMRERAVAVGGLVSVRSEVGTGTEVTAVIPF